MGSSVRGATVRAYRLGAQGELIAQTDIATAQTDANGGFTLSSLSPGLNGNVFVLEATGGEFTDLATCRTLSLEGQTLYSSAYIQNEGAIFELVITPLTDLAFRLARNKTRSSTTLPSWFQVVEQNAHLAGTFRLPSIDPSGLTDITQVKPAALQGLAPSQLGGQSVWYGLALAVISHQATEQNLSMTDWLARLQADADDDGILNGAGLADGYTLEWEVNRMLASPHNPFFARTPPTPTSEHIRIDLYSPDGFAQQGTDPDILLLDKTQVFSCTTLTPTRYDLHWLSCYISESDFNAIADNANVGFGHYQGTDRPERFFGTLDKTKLAAGKLSFQEQLHAGREKVLKQLQARDRSIMNPDEIAALDTAAAEITKSLDDALWHDQTHLDLKRGSEFFTHDAAAIRAMQEFSGQRTDQESQTFALQIISGLSIAERGVSAAALDDAKYAGATQQAVLEIGKLQEQAFVAENKSQIGKLQNLYYQVWVQTQALLPRKPEPIMSKPKQLPFLLEICVDSVESSSQLHILYD